MTRPTQLRGGTRLAMVQVAAGLSALVFLATLLVTAGWGALLVGVGLSGVTLVWAAVDVARDHNRPPAGPGQHRG